VWLADLGSSWGGPGPLLDLDPGLRLQVWKAGGEALGHGLQVGDIRLCLVLLPGPSGSSGRS